MKNYEIMVASTSCASWLNFRDFENIPEANSSDAAAASCADTPPDVRVSVYVFICM